MAAAEQELDAAAQAMAAALAQLMSQAQVSASLTASVDGLALRERYRAATATTPPTWNHTTIPFPAFPGDVIDPQLALPEVGTAEYERLLAVLARLDDCVDAIAALMTAEKAPAGAGQPGARRRLPGAGRRGRGARPVRGRSGCRRVRGTSRAGGRGVARGADAALQDPAADAGALASALLAAASAGVSEAAAAAADLDEQAVHALARSVAARLEARLAGVLFTVDPADLSGSLRRARVRAGGAVRRPPATRAAARGTRVAGRPGGGRACSASPSERRRQPSAGGCPRVAVRPRACARPRRRDAHGVRRG